VINDSLERNHDPFERNHDPFGRKPCAPTVNLIKNEK
jgi:hypothetical protein